MSAYAPSTPAARDGEQASLLARGWEALPPSYRMPERTPSLAEAQAYCRRLAESHYENFHVASWFLPERLRVHFHSIYAYCRISDDMGDEVGNPAQALALLAFWGGELEACYRGEVRHPVFVALADTIHKCDIPPEPFRDLLCAFRQDQTVTRYEGMGDLLQYCRFSANPVGRLVLYVCGYRDAERFALSDETCTALQLANFWQDVRPDYGKGRIYLPLEAMRAAGVSEESLAAEPADGRFRGLLAELVRETRERFHRGATLIGMVDRELAIDLDLFTRGGLAILDAIAARDYDVLSARPAISKASKVRLLLRSVAAKYLPGRRALGLLP